MIKSEISRPSRRLSSQAFTLIELVIVIVIIAVLATMGGRTIMRLGENRNFNITLRRTENLQFAIAGNPKVVENGVRLDFGYIGDVGLMPPNLDALLTDPGLPGWNGPYLHGKVLQEDPTAMLRDGWQNPITYTVPGDPSQPPTLSSTSGGGDPIVRNIASSVNALMNNTVALRVLNTDGYPLRGTEAKVNIHYAGAWNTMSYSKQLGFYLNTVPIGVRNVHFIVSGDTSLRLISVGPNNSTTSPELGLEFTVNPQFGNIQYVGSSVTLSGTNNSEITFTVQNTGSPTFEIHSVEISWSNSSCWQCPYAYLGAFVVNSLNYWKWNTNNRSAMASTNARLVLDETLNIAKGTRVIGPLQFFDKVDGSGTAQPMDDVNVTVAFISLLAPNQTITFTTPGSCTPASITYNTPTAYGGTAPHEDVSVNLQNTGDPQAHITGVTIKCNKSPQPYLEAIAFTTDVNTYWQAQQSWCDYASRQQVPDLASAGVTITFCKTQPEALIPGNGSLQIRFLNFTSDGGGSTPVDMHGVTFSVTAHFECLSDQTINFTTP